MLLSELPTVTAVACPLLCSQPCYSGLLFSELQSSWFCLTKQRDPDPILLPVCGRRWPGSFGARSLVVFFFFFLLLSSSRRSLTQLQLEGRDLHGIQADGGVVGQRRAGVHQRQGHGLQQLQVQVLEQSRYAQLHRGKAA